MVPGLRMGHARLHQHHIAIGNVGIFMLSPLTVRAIDRAAPGWGDVEVLLHVVEGFNQAASSYGSEHGDAEGFSGTPSSCGAGRPSCQVIQPFCGWRRRLWIGPRAQAHALHHLADGGAVAVVRNEFSSQS